LVGLSAKKLKQAHLALFVPFSSTFEATACHFFAVSLIGVARRGMKNSVQGHYQKQK
jgi:hypothetical protein